jgi:hypothetical protein
MQINKFDITQTANGTSETFGINNADAIGITVAFNANVSAGTITLETAPGADYAGTWATQLTAAYTSGAPVVVTDGVGISGVVGRLRLASIAGASASVTTTVSLNSYN